MIQDRRKLKRIKIDKLSRINDSECKVINVSREGLMLSADSVDSANTDTDEQIQVKFNIKGEWVQITAIVVWRIQDVKSNAVSIGAFIKDAPKEYEEYLENLYFEVSET